MEIPKANYVVDSNGDKIFVQITVDDWNAFVQEYSKLREMFVMKGKLKTAFKQMQKIQKGQNSGTTLNDFLNEL